MSLPPRRYFFLRCGNSDDLGSRYLKMNGKRRLLGRSIMAPWRMRFHRQLGRRSVNLAVKW